MLQTEAQCEAVCFGSGVDDSKKTLLNILKPASCVILCSTVTAVWAQKAQQRFQTKGILFVDCPVSGGAARARQGDLTLMSSGDADSLIYAKPVLEAMGSTEKIYIIEGGAGMGSTAKMVHQLLAGVHVAVSAEALALAAKAGLDVHQMYDIVSGAAGSSWMFQDRGPRMLQGKEAPVKSQTQIFVKDLDIVSSEAKRLQSPIPIALSALQQFISAKSSGLGKQDDSQVVQVYETVSGVSVAQQNKHSKRHKISKEGTKVGDLWTMEDGKTEEIVEVGMEPRHHLVLSNEYVRVLRVSFAPNDTTLAHRHAEDSLYFFLVEGGLEVVNHVQGQDPVCDCMDFGEVRFGNHKSDKPLVHKITNKTSKQMLCVDAEVLKSPPVINPFPLVAEKHELIKSRDRCRVYKLELAPGESVIVTYPFFHFSVIVQGGTVEKEFAEGTNGAPSLKWTETFQIGDVDWKEPIFNMKKSNLGQTTFVEYVSEWR
mmetsp:Transcript_102/g.434  ORF Transcript_102/g.434 Transcript_102/m.434 type:complete len:484 (-) Transcript_102:62-1513(-)